MYNILPTNRLALPVTGLGDCTLAATQALSAMGSTPMAILAQLDWTHVTMFLKPMSDAGIGWQEGLMPWML